MNKDEKAKSLKNKIKECTTNVNLPKKQKIKVNASSMQNTQKSTKSEGDKLNSQITKNNTC